MLTKENWAEYFPGVPDFELKKKKEFSDFLEQTENSNMSIMEKIKKNAVDLWENHKVEILIGTIWGGIGIYSVIAMALGFKRQKAFNKEVKAKYGPNATHGNIFGGSIPKRRADLEAWEKGNRKVDFDQVMKFAKTLHIGSDDVYTIEGFKNPDDEHIAVAVFQQCGEMFHSDWIA